VRPGAVGRAVTRLSLGLSRELWLVQAGIFLNMLGYRNQIGVGTPVHGRDGLFLVDRPGDRADARRAATEPVAGGGVPHRRRRRDRGRRLGARAGAQAPGRLRA